MKKLFFDLETNGLYNCSVLSFSALLTDENNKILKIYDRFYYRRWNEKPNNQALRINGLYDDIIKEKRKNARYNKYFFCDKQIENLIKNADMLIAHNINFDLSFVMKSFKNIDYSQKMTFCTMLETQYLYDAPYEVNDEPKYPKLSESANYFNIDIDKIRENTQANFHSSLFDIFVCFEIYKRLTE